MDGHTASLEVDRTPLTGQLTIPQPSGTPWGLINFWIRA